MVKHENCGGEIVDGDPARCSGCKALGYGTKQMPDGTVRLYPIADVQRLEEAMWEIIERKWNSATDPMNEKFKPHIYSEEIQNELIAKSVDIPDGEMYKILAKWQNQRMEAIEFGEGPGQTQHGNMKIIKVYPRIC